jgi:hypothetical protein
MGAGKYPITTNTQSTTDGIFIQNNAKWPMFGLDVERVLKSSVTNRTDHATVNSGGSECDCFNRLSHEYTARSAR